MTIRPLLFRFRGWTLALPIGYAVLFERGRVSPGPLDWTAGAILLAGAASLRLWARRYIGRSSDTKTRKVSSFTSGGPYAHVRNPLYIANLAAAAATCILLGFRWLAPVTLLLGWLEYELLVREEEKLLPPEYLKEVPRWIPRVTVRFAPSSTPRLTWRQTIRREGKRLPGYATVIVAAALVKEALSRSG